MNFKIQLAEQYLLVSENKQNIQNIRKMHTEYNNVYVRNANQDIENFYVLMNMLIQKKNHYVANKSKQIREFYEIINFMKSQIASQYRGKRTFEQFNNAEAPRKYECELERLYFEYVVNE